MQGSNYRERYKVKEVDCHMQVEYANFERIELLRVRVTEMYRAGINFPELGTIALELLTIRNELETKSAEMPKENLKKFTHALRELEKTVISLYMLNLLSEKRQHRIEDYLFRDYSIYSR